MTEDATPPVRVVDRLGPTLKRLRMYLTVYASAVLMLPGWMAGLMWHRMHDGWNLARRQLHRLDDAVIDDMATHQAEEAFHQDDGGRG